MIANNEIELNGEVTTSNVAEVIQNQIKDNEVLVYMKGNSMMPQCGFSAQTVEILNRVGVPFKTFDVLSNMEIREGIKQFSNWPTIPQLYFKQKFIGGCDIVTQMYQNGELDSLLKK